MKRGLWFGGLDGGRGGQEPHPMLKPLSETGNP